MTTKESSTIIERLESWYDAKIAELEERRDTISSKHYAIADLLQRGLPERTSAARAHES